ncbi:MAG: hypothetical protein JXR64_04380 [Spirochaetales bacterium]|nr:hypothetical protein [Spirochaetales bacterium]
MKFKQTFIITLVIIFLFSCNNKDYKYYIDSKNPKHEELKKLFPLLNKYTDYDGNRFTVMDKIITNMIKNSEPGDLRLFITDYINNNQNDPYITYYLLSLASSYLINGENNLAIPLLHKSVMLYKDLIINGESTHLNALQTLVGLTADDNMKIVYYKKIINEHSDRVNLGEIYYYLGKTLDKVEKWDEAIKAYEKYLDYPYTTIKSEPSARDNTLQKVGFYYSDKTWVVKDLDTLVQRVKYAISTKNATQLDRYRAYDFFIINWKSKFSDLKSSYPMESYVLTNMNLKTGNELDPMSTENEAYLAVNGSPWSSSIWYVYPTWYFYFRKVDFPKDPEIHGGWEWEGIYLGEKL